MKFAKMINTSKGSTTLPMILLLCVLLYFGVNLTSNQLKHFKTYQASAENVICLKHQLKLVENYISYIQKTNYSIRIAKAATLVPKTRVAAKIILENLKRSQYMRSHYYQAQRFTSKYCRLSRVLSYPQDPYRRGNKIKRGLDETARFARKKSHVKIFSKFHAKNFISANLIYKGGLKLKDYFINPKDLSFSSPFSGVRYYF